MFQACKYLIINVEFYPQDCDYLEEKARRKNLYHKGV
jgi:hypothetical protein